jgi:hypothetical protein
MRVEGPGRGECHSDDTHALLTESARDRLARLALALDSRPRPGKSLPSTVNLGDQFGSTRFIDDDQFADADFLPVLAELASTPTTTSSAAGSIRHGMASLAGYTSRPSP